MEQKPYSLCFGGVALPEPYQTYFAQTSQAAETFFPGIKLMYPRVPGHVTATYLGDLDPSDIRIVAAVMAEHSPRLIGQYFHLTGIRIDQRRFGFRTWIGVDAPDAWHRFVEDINDDLTGLTADHLTYFAKSPHVTIGNRKFGRDGKFQLAVAFNQRLLKERARKLEGSFPISELNVWGIDAEDQARVQIKRGSIPLGGRNKRLFYGAAIQESSA